MKIQNIKEIREKLNLTQKKFADLIGVDRRTVINYENGNVIPKSKQLLIQSIINQNLNINKNLKLDFEKQLNNVDDSEKKINEPSTKKQINNSPESIELKYITILEEEKTRLNNKIHLLEKEVLRLENENPHLKKENTKLKSDATKLMDDNFKLNTEIFKLKNETIKLNNENSDLTKKNKKLVDENFYLNDELLMIKKK